MDDTIRYLNTDLDVSSREELTGLTSALASRGMHPLHSATKGGDGQWYVTFETDASFEEPEPNIAAMVAAVESLEVALRTEWFACSLREFNVGYDCGSKPWAFNQGLSSELLGRIAAIGASLRVTLYPPEREKDNTRQE